MAITVDFDKNLYSIFFFSIKESNLPIWAIILMVVLGLVLIGMILGSTFLREIYRTDI